MAMIVSWGICAILTTTDALPSDPKAWGYSARTDVRADVLQKTKWFRFPYPGKIKYIIGSNFISTQIILIIVMTLKLTDNK